MDDISEYSTSGSCGWCCHGSVKLYMLSLYSNRTTRCTWNAKEITTTRVGIHCEQPSSQHTQRYLLGNLAVSKPNWKKLLGTQREGSWPSESLILK